VTPAPTSAPPTAAGAPSLPLLREAFATAQAAPSSGPAVRITRDVTVTVEGRQYLAKRDEFYPLANVKSDELILLIGDREASIPTQAGEIADEEPIAKNPRTAAAPNRAGEPREEAELEPDATSPALTESDAQREAIRRYPNLGIAGTVENRLFITAIKEQRSTGEVDFFKDPRWPITLAELLAEQEGWRRADAGRPPAIIDEDSPAPTAPPSSASGSRGTSGSRR
jgi:hypothetical protein